MLSEAAEIKAKEILKQQQQLKIKQNKALINRIVAINLINDTCLPYRILIDILQDNTSKEIQPNRFYPAPAETLKAEELKPGIEDIRYKEKMIEYENQLKEEEWKEDKWQYYFGRFLVGYDINNFTFFDFIGSNNINDAKGINIKEWKQLLLDTQKKMQEEPNKFYLEPNERKEAHLKKYNVPMGYMKGV